MFHYDQQTEADLGELEAWGFIVKRYTPYHIRIIEPEFRGEIDVWATKQKLWDKEARVRSQHYKGLFRSVKRLLDGHYREKIRAEMSA